MILTDIIITTHNLEDFTVQCLASIRRNTKNYRIVWVDNGSNEESRARVAEMLVGVPHVVIANSENLGFVRAVNQGIRASAAEYIVILNNDTIVTAGWLERMGRPFAQDDSTGLVGPLTSTEESWQGIGRLRTDPRFRAEFDDLPSVPSDASPEDIAGLLYQACHGQMVEIRGMIAFFCVMTTRHVVERVGMLSEEFGVGFCDDDDYCYRVKQAGYKLYVVKDAFVFHHHRTTFRLLYSEQDIARMIGENKLRFKSKWGRDRMPFYKDG